MGGDFFVHRPSVSSRMPAFSLRGQHGLREALHARHQLHLVHIRVLFVGGPRLADILPQRDVGSPTSPVAPKEDGHPERNPRRLAVPGGLPHRDHHRVAADRTNFGEI